jgi:hypothetical protein
LRTKKLQGNVGEPSTGNTEIPAVEPTSVHVGEDSKFLYFNDSYDLDEIPLDVETIIDLNDNDGN